ncbi:unnamed protein product [Thelazia callipaeda]|uniref:Long-chain-fatty-acid--CoA ligase n=1 Tax=Thelazia callipaeda TaxID=103827 RepID=A0A0N5CLP5_THECL|nr:unnamed protein product [Thelazia callipaeda]
MADEYFGSFATLGMAAVVTLGTAGYFWMTGGPIKRQNALLDYKQQTRVLKDGSRVAACLKDDNLVPGYYSDVKTICEAVLRGLRESKNGRMLGIRKTQLGGSSPYVWLTYKEVLARSENLALGFETIGLTRGQDTFIGIYVRNRPEWVIAELATYNNRSVLVPIYETLGQAACNFIVNQTQLQIVIVDDERKALNVFKSKADCPSIKYVVVIDAYTDSLKEKARAVGISLFQFTDLEERGMYSEKRNFDLPSSEDLCTIAYTSGTTGQPKGAMITHGNVIACTTGLDFFRTCGFQPGDSMISFLPLAHMFERLLETAAFMCGVSVGYYSGNIKTLINDIQELKPTIMPAVPRVLNRLYDNVISELNKSYIAKVLFLLGMALKRRYLQLYVNFSGILRNNFWEKFLFQKIRDGLGGRVKLIISGSAPLSGEVLDFVRITMGCVVLEGYGQTECVAECTLSCEGDSSTGCVGIPVYCNKIKLFDVPELGYFVKDEVGEICVKGYNVFKGYYRNEELSREAIDADGWLHTGDIGRWTKCGTLSIVDRKKHIFKLSQGEFIAPEKVELIYTHSKYVSQIFVYGESLKSCLIGIVVPKAEEMYNLAKNFDLLKDSLFELCKNEKVKKTVLDNMIETAKRSGLCSLEQVKDIYLCSEPFSVENNLLTPTMKNKRVELKKRFANELAKMYSKLQ